MSLEGPDTWEDRMLSFEITKSARVTGKLVKLRTQARARDICTSPPPTFRREHSLSSISSFLCADYDYQLQNRMNLHTWPCRCGPFREEQETFGADLWISELSAKESGLERRRRPWYERLFYTHIKVVNTEIMDASTNSFQNNRQAHTLCRLD